MRFALAIMVAAVPLAAQTVQYRSPAGVEYRAQNDTGPVARATAALAADPNNVERIIQLGVAQSGARQFREAIATFTRGIAIAPNNAILYRWRGHRYLSVREFDRAMDDFTRGARLDSTIYGIWYHLGVLRFVRGDFAGAAEAFKRSQPRAPDAGELAGSTDWLWMSLMRAGRAAEAKAMLARRPDSLATTVAYAQRLRLYRGEVGPDAVMTPADTGDVAVATLSFGIGNWYLVNGDTARARSWFERSVRSGGWPGFGFIASEAELRRLAPGNSGLNDAANQMPISTGQRIGGVIVSAYIGLGVGHAVIGKYGEAGKYFTMAELGGGMMAVAALGSGYDCGECGGAAPTLFWAGVGVIAVARVWEIIDVIVRPADHNAAIEAAQKTATASSHGLTLAPIIQNGRRGIGVGMRF